jgi:hypothetical protein
MKKWIFLTIGGMAFRWFQKKRRGHPALRGQRR